MEVAARRVADRDARTAQPARSARGAACAIIARAHPLLTLPRGPWGHRSAVRGCMTSTVRAARSLRTPAADTAVRDCLHFDCIERAARNRTARAAWQDRGGTPRAHSGLRSARHGVAEATTPQSDDAPDVRAHSAPDVPARSRRDSTISPRGEVGTGCALPARLRSPR